MLRLRTSIQRTLLTLIWLCAVAFAGLAQLTVIVPPQVAEGETFQLVYRAAGAHELGAFTAPQIATELKVLYGPQLNVLHKMSGGVSKEYTTITYTLQATKAGSYSISAAQLRVGQKSLKALSKRIQVAKAQGLTQQPIASGESLQIADRDMYMRAVVSSQSVYTQQPVLVSLYLYSRYGNLAGVDRKPPEVTDFVTKEIPLQHTSLTTERVGGRLMYKALIWQILAYPQRSGELVIPSFEYDFQVSVNRKVDNEEDLFANKAVATAHKKLHSQPLKLTVRPLPEGAPEGFDQLVGSFQIQGTLSAPDPTYETGRAMTYRLEITGRGNVSLLLAPELGLSDKFEVYEPQLIRDDQEVRNGNTEVHRIYEYTIIPHTTGQQTVPAVSLPYFDPATNSYRTATTAPIRIEVAQGSNDVPQVGKAGEASSSQRYTPYPYDAPAPTIVWRPWSRAGWAYWLLYVLLLIGGGVAYWLIRSGQRLRADHVAYHKKRSTPMAEQQIQAIRQLIKAEQQSEATTRLYATITHYLQDHYALATSSLTRQQLASVLKQQGVADAEVNAWLSLLSEVELTRYAPLQDGDSLPRWVDQLEQLISQS